MTIVTQNIFPPIPFRGFDWNAIDDDTYDGPGCPQGFGRTEEEAIADLLEQIGWGDQGIDTQSHTPLDRDGRKTMATFDQKCADLAEYFLQDEPDLRDRRDRLAFVIQQAVEDWIDSERAEDRRKAFDDSGSDLPDERS
jgi:hypothetical protein